MLATGKAAFLLPLFKKYIVAKMDVYVICDPRFSGSNLNVTIFNTIW